MRSSTSAPLSIPTPVTPELPADTALLWAAVACTAVASPTFIAFNVPPSATFLNQAAALVGWGAWLTLMLAMVPRQAFGASASMKALLLAFGLLLVAALAAPFWAGLPWTLSLSSAGTMLAGVLAALAGAALQRAGFGIAAFKAFCIALVVAGIGSSLIGLLQVYAPQWADGDWIARTAFEGRAVGNLRQPNHLSSLLLWSVIAAVWLGETRVFKRPVAWGLSLLFVFVIVLSASRTGALGMLLLAAWGIVDRRLSPSMRRLLWIAPVAYGLFWWGNSAWADYSHHVFGGETRFGTGGDVSSSRFGIWSNTLTLIRMHPWIGVGFGEFNFAWTLTPFPHRPTAFFDHTHNLVLQFVVELGIPLALLVLGLLAWAMLSALQRAVAAAADTDASQAPMLRAAFMMVFMIIVHSLLEYPLWYAYFLLPTMFALGLCLERPVPGNATARDPRTGNAGAGRTRPLLIASMLLVCSGFFAVFDYLQVVVIFSPPNGAGPLAQRIVDGRRSWLFGHHADYAAATTVDHPGDVMASFRRAPHYLLDARLLLAWAKALNEAGEVDKARYVAARLKEFRNDQADDFFSECEDPPEVGQAAPFQCTPPSKEFRYEDFR